MARKLVAAFGDQVFEVIERQPQRLREVPGIGRGLAARIVTAWREQRAVRDIMLFLHSHGLSPLRAARIFEAYGERAIQAVSKNPYRLARDIRGIGFQSADQLAERLGIASDSPVSPERGPCPCARGCARPGPLRPAAGRADPRAAALLGVDAAAVETALTVEVAAGGLIEAASTARLSSSRDPSGGAGDRGAAARAGERPAALVDRGPEAPRPGRAPAGAASAPGQRAALAAALASKPGDHRGPGTGKTTLVEAILLGLAEGGVDVQLAAPTGRAAPPRREHRARRQDPAPPARSGTGTRLSPGRRAPADLRSADRRRDVDGRSAADAGDARRAAAQAALLWSATSTSCRRSARGRCWPT